MWSIGGLRIIIFGGAGACKNCRKPIFGLHLQTRPTSGGVIISSTIKLALARSSFLLAMIPTAMTTALQLPMSEPTSDSAWSGFWISTPSLNSSMPSRTTSPTALMEAPPQLTTLRSIHAAMTKALWDGQHISEYQNLDDQDCGQLTLTLRGTASYYFRRKKAPGFAARASESAT